MINLKIQGKEGGENDEENRKPGNNVFEAAVKSASSLWKSHKNQSGNIEIVWMSSRRAPCHENRETDANQSQLAARRNVCSTS